MNFWTWNQNLLLQHLRISLQLNDYNTGGGELKNGKFTYNFVWKNVLEMSYTTWNSFCISFQSSNLNFAINGKFILNLTEVKQTVYDKIDVTKIVFGSKLFSGLISDFNMWSRGLSRHGCTRVENLRGEGIKYFFQKIRVGGP